MKYINKQTGLEVTRIEGSCPYYGHVRADGCSVTSCIPVDVVEKGNDWEKVVEEPLLITEDGVVIFDRHQVLYAVNISNWIACSTKVSAWGDITGGKEYSWKFFSTKEARLNYMASTENLFTIAEVVGLRYHTHSEVLEKAKKKLKANDSNL